MALRAALFARQEGGRIFVLLDNQSAVNALKTGNSASCMWETRTFHDIACKVGAETRWVPGHSKIIGNEEADAAARSALQLLPSRQTEPDLITLAYLRRLMHNRRQELVDKW